MDLFSIFQILFTLFCVSSALTPEQYNKQRDHFVSIQSQLRQIAEDYRQKGYYSITKWLNKEQILFKEEAEVESFMSKFKWKTDVCSVTYQAIYNSNLKAFRHFEYFRSPSTMAHFLKANLLIQTGAKLATGDRALPTAEEMAEAVADVIEREAIVGSSFETPDDESDILYEEMIGLHYGNNILPLSIAEIETLEQMFVNLVESHPKLSFVDTLKERLAKGQKIGVQIRELGAIDSEAAMNKLVRLAEEYFPLMYSVYTIVESNGFACPEGECKTLAEIEIDEQKKEQCKNWKNPHTEL